MPRTGPTIETLTRRLVDTPPDFLDEPRIGSAGRVAVAALVNDLMHRYGKRLQQRELSRFDAATLGPDRNRLALVMIAVWLLADRWFLGEKPSHEAIARVLDETMTELAATTAAHKFVSDPDRREELARVILARLDYVPEGETPAQATDRLSSLSTTERRRLLEASRAAQQRAREVALRLGEELAKGAPHQLPRVAAGQGAGRPHHIDDALLAVHLDQQVGGGQGEGREAIALGAELAGGIGAGVSGGRIGHGSPQYARNP